MDIQSDPAALHVEVAARQSLDIVESVTLDVVINTLNVKRRHAHVAVAVQRRGIGRYCTLSGDSPHAEASPCHAPCCLFWSCGLPRSHQLFNRGSVQNRRARSDPTAINRSTTGLDRRPAMRGHPVKAGIGVAAIKSCAHRTQYSSAPDWSMVLRTWLPPRRGRCDCGAATVDAAYSHCICGSLPFHASEAS
jgi:hypothetical protein